MSFEKITRGKGLLEKFLSIQRMKKANSIINKQKKKGKILDIGCGSYPFFLLNSDFSDKYGIDQEIKNLTYKNLKLNLYNQNICEVSKLPFKKDFFDVITMLAVIEHLNYYQILKILKECYSLLKRGGLIIITTPANWSDILLKMMAKVHIVSPIEISDHKNSFNLKQLDFLLIKSGFKKESIQKGYFEFFLNLYIWAKK